MGVGVDRLTDGPGAEAVRAGRDLPLWSCPPAPLDLSPSYPAPSPGLMGGCAALEQQREQVSPPGAYPLQAFHPLQALHLLTRLIPTGTL